MITLTSRWCTTTHMLVAAWGEFTPTVEDVAKLLSLNVLGDVNLATYVLSMEEQKLVTVLKKGYVQGQWSSRYSGETRKQGNDCTQRKHRIMGL